MLVKKFNTTNGTDYLGALNASEVVVDTTNFDNNLSSSDSDLQTALETLDELSSGGETVNIETLTADKTLTATDATVQILQTGSANRTVNLPTTGLTTGHKFEFWNRDAYDSTYYIDIMQDEFSILHLDSKSMGILRWDGANWFKEFDENISIGSYTYNNYGSGVGIGTGSLDNYNYGVGIGSANSNYDYGVGIGATAANNYNFGVGIGCGSQNNYEYGVGVGNNTYTNHDYGIGIGNYSNFNYNYGVGIGHRATSNSKQTGTVAIGAYSKAERNREIISTATASTTNKAQMTIQKFKEIDMPNNTGTWVELFVDASSSRLILLSNSVYNFFGEFNCYRTVTNDEGTYPVGAVKGWQINGLIKNVAGTVSLVGTPTKTLLGCDSDAEISNVDLQIQADDTNNSLKISVYVPLGSGGQTYRFSGNIFASETRA